MIEALFYAKINNVGDNCVVHNDETTSHIDVHPRINMVGKRKKGQKAKRERKKRGTIYSSLIQQRIIIEEIRVAEG